MLWLSLKGIYTFYQVIVRGAHPNSPKNYQIKLFDCETYMQISEWASKCDHEFNAVIEVSFGKGRKRYFAESCYRCPRITLYDAQTKAPILAYDDRNFMPGRLVNRNGKILMSELSGDRIVELQWDQDQMKLLPTGRMMNVDLGLVTGMTYLKKRNIVVMVAFDKKLIQALRFPNGEVQWELSGQVDGKVMRPRGVCSEENNGLVFIADFMNKRVVVVEGQTGKVIQVVLKDEYQIVYDVCWKSEKLHLVVKHGQENRSKISLFNLD